MDDKIIQIENVSKRYIIQHETAERYTALRDVIAKNAVKAFRRVSSPLKRGPGGISRSEEFWALKDVSFDIARGERVGIIGRNGAGKSTILKIISRITEPTAGRITLRGRVASLLEVGTGFHPELTGRENIFLNGSILGMARTEISAKFDEIVAFAEIEKFLDTPVKRYSSGMYVRLAFAVAAHLEPEILLVDEVLAVGDAAFQKKCLGKMEDISRESSRTVLFVSHNMTAIKALCNRCVLLDKGGVAYQGDVGIAIDKYMDVAARPSEGTSIAMRKRGGGLSLRAKIIDFCVITPDGENPQYMNSAIPFKARFTIEAYEENTRVGPQIYINDESQRLIWIDAASMHNKIYSLSKGIHTIECDVAPTNLYAGVYRLSCVLSMPGQEVIDYIPDAISVEVAELDPNSTGYNLQRNYGFGYYYVDHKWSDSKRIDMCEQR